MDLGEKIRDQRRKAGLSQEQLAEKLNVSRQAITKWETNRGIPDISNLIAISDEFGLSLDELIKEDGAVKKKIISDSSAKKMAHAGDCLSAGNFGIYCIFCHWSQNLYGWVFDRNTVYVVF